VTQTNGSRKTVAVALGWNAVVQPGQVGAPEMERHAAEGHFKAGSMEPTIDAAMRFARSGSA
jgi:carbamate kinase